MYAVVCHDFLSNTSLHAKLCKCTQWLSIPRCWYHVHNIKATVPDYFIVNIYLFVYFVIQIFILYYIIQPDISFILSSHCYSGLHQIPLLCGCMYCELHEFLGCFLRSCVISVAAVLSHCCVLFIFFSTFGHKDSTVAFS